MTEDQPTAAEPWPYLNIEPSAGWRPGQKRMRERKDVAHTISGAFSMLRSAARRPNFDLPDLAALVEHDAPKWLLQIGVDNLRRQGHSWSEVATSLGTSKPAAIERFGGAS